jgi:hypothetical protein
MLFKKLFLGLVVMVAVFAPVLGASTLQLVTETGSLYLNSTGLYNSAGDRISGSVDMSDLTPVFVNRSDWTTIDSYPSPCAAGSFVTQVGDTLTCATPDYYSDSDISGGESAFSGWDKDSSDDFSGSWSDLTSVPAGFADGVDNVGTTINELDDIGNVDTTGVSTDDALVYNGSSWVSGTVQGGLWTNSSGDATFVGGNVGIGTTSPVVPLHVEYSSNSELEGLRIKNSAVGEAATSAIRILNRVNSQAQLRLSSPEANPINRQRPNQFQLVSTGSGGIAIATATSSGVIRLVTGGFPSAAASTEVLTAINDAIGINNTSPETALDVGGTVTATAFVGDGSGLTGITTNASAINYWTNSSGNLTFVDGNVGIGTTSPTSELMVDGDVNVTGTVYYGSLQANSPVVYETSDDYLVECKPVKGGWIVEYDEIVLGSVVTHKEVLGSKDTWEHQECEAKIARLEYYDSVRGETYNVTVTEEYQEEYTVLVPYNETVVNEELNVTEVVEKTREETRTRQATREVVQQRKIKPTDIEWDSAKKQATTDKEIKTKKEKDKKEKERGEK